MVVPNYTYPKLKMLGPKGVITVEGSFEQAYYYEQDCVTQAAALIAPRALDGPSRDTGRAPAKEVAKAMAALNRPSIDGAADDSGSSDGSGGPSI